MKKALFILALLFALAACDSKTEKDTIVVSIIPQKYFVHQLIGETIHIEVMIPPGASPASYEATARQMVSIQKAKLYFQMGQLGFEMHWLDRFRENNTEMNVINMSTNSSLIKGAPIKHGDHYHVGGIDPHIWMSPKEMIKAIPIMASALSEAFPEMADTIKINEEALLASIQELDMEISQMLKDTKSRSFMIYHPALTYYARDYELEQIPIEYEGKEPGPAYMKKVMDMVAEKGIRYIFVQKEFDIERAQIIASETGAIVQVIDPLSEEWDEELLRITSILSDTNISE